MINWARFEELRHEIGEDGIGEVVEIFLEEVEETLGQLSEPQSDADRAASLHFLKGSALNLGFDDVARLCDTPPGGPAAAPTADIIAAFEIAKAALLDGLDRKKAPAA